MTFRRAGKAGAVVAMVLAATLFQPTSAASAAGGDWLDGSYGSAGTTILPDELGFYPHYSTDSADRLYVLTGTFGETRLRRLTPNGAVDPTFAGGLLTVASPAAYGVHADAGGTVTIAGPNAVGLGSKGGPIHQRRRAGPRVRQRRVRDGGRRRGQRRDRVRGPGGRRADRRDCQLRDGSADHVPGGADGGGHPGHQLGPGRPEAGRAGAIDERHQPVRRRHRRGGARRAHRYRSRASSCCV